VVAVVVAQQFLATTAQVAEPVECLQGQPLLLRERLTVLLSVLEVVAVATLQLGQTVVIQLRLA
jgi:hypothetical protein